MEQTNNNYDAIFWVAIVFAFLAGWAWGRGELWTGFAFFMVSLILLSIKWIFIVLDYNQSITREENENENE